MSAVFQDYTSSLHPFQTVRDILFEVMCQCDKQSLKEMETTATQLLDEVGLSSNFLEKYPNMLSGGEAQRVAVARAICINPTYILFDGAHKRARHVDTNSNSRFIETVKRRTELKLYIYYA